MKTSRCTFLSLVFLVISTPSVVAVPFDVIVPEEIQIDTASPRIGVCFHHWGWIIATEETITQTELDFGAVFITTDSLTVSISQDGFSNTFLVAPLDSLDVAGLRLDPENASAYDSLLIPGETLKDPSVSMFTTEIIFPSDYADTVIATGTMVIAGHELAYTTRIVFGSFGPVPTVTAGQRITATAIPVTVWPTTWGGLKTRFLEDKDRQKP